MSTPYPATPLLGYSPRMGGSELAGDFCDCSRAVGTVSPGVILTEWGWGPPASLFQLSPAPPSIQRFQFFSSRFQSVQLCQVSKWAILANKGNEKKEKCCFFCKIQFFGGVEFSGFCLIRGLAQFRLRNPFPRGGRGPAQTPVDK